ncbi:RNA polymerase sigma factor SigJ [Streptomyces sp. NPDC046716]|uniref:RNA polymerase sigma factor SigJ n=1 Tax=Streptomyces sp. NPDC046716 TaxID=3157093 RepID=UPI0033D627E8
MDVTQSTVLGERRHLTNLTYRLLGSLTEAEDAVQETYARWYGLSEQRRAAVENPGAWLTTVAGRICLDQLGSARVRRERYVGEWIPEPLPDRAHATGAAGDGDPADRITLDESVSMAFLVVLESMTPAERVAFVLHDVFRYAFAEIAEILGRTPAACRQLASSGRGRIRAARTATTGPDRQAVLVGDFKRAWQAKDIAALVALLDPDATMAADGGGVVAAARHPVVGGEEIARYLALFARKATGLVLRERTVNGTPGLVAEVDGVPATVAAFDCADGRVTRIWAVRNPEKLGAWARQAQNGLPGSDPAG